MKTLHSFKLPILQLPMTIEKKVHKKTKYSFSLQPSTWLTRFCHLIPNKGSILEVACGNGRNTGFLIKSGYNVTAVDIDTKAITKRLRVHKALNILTIDLENKQSPFKNNALLADKAFDGVVVINYLYRPILHELLDCIKPNGVLIYETFCIGNEKFGRPKNLNHLLKPNELFELVQHKFQTIAYECGPTEIDKVIKIKQRIVAINSPNSIVLGENIPPIFSNKSI